MPAWFVRRLRFSDEFSMAPTAAAGFISISGRRCIFRILLGGYNRWHFGNRGNIIRILVALVEFKCDFKIRSRNFLKIHRTHQKTPSFRLRWVPAATMKGEPGIIRINNSPSGLPHRGGLNRLRSAAIISQFTSVGWKIFDLHIKDGVPSPRRNIKAGVCFSAVARSNKYVKFKLAVKRII